jgi:hypothetical protein
MDSLLPFLQGLAPLQHVGLSRRTEDHRQPGRYWKVTDSFGARPWLAPVDFPRSDIPPSVAG